MSIKNSDLGGTDWTTGTVLTHTDLNDTFDVVALVIPPVGSILPWAKTITGVPALLDNWIECDGSTISDADSPMNGQDVPDLNTTQSFLRGSATSGSTGGADTHAHGTGPSGGGRVETDNTGSYGYITHSSSLPVYYEVVWIMRIK